MLDKFVSLLGDVADFLKVVWENALKPLIDWIVENVLPVLLPIIDGVVKALMSAAGMIADVIGGILQFLVGIFTGDWQKAWDGIIKIFDGAKDSLERMKPFGDESFDTVEQDFPVEYVQAKPVVW